MKEYDNIEFLELCESGLIEEQSLWIVMRNSEFFPEVCILNKRYQFGGSGENNWYLENHNIGPKVKDCTDAIICGPFIRPNNLSKAARNRFLIKGIIE